MATMDDHQVPSGLGWSCPPTQDPELGWWECQGLQTGVLGSLRAMLHLLPSPTAQHQLRARTVSCRGKWRIRGCVPSDEGAARGAGTAPGWCRAASPWALSSQHTGRD